MCCEDDGWVYGDFEELLRDGSDTLRAASGSMDWFLPVSALHEGFVVRVDAEEPLLSFAVLYY